MRASRSFTGVLAGIALLVAGLAAARAEEADPADAGVEEAQYLEESLTHRDPEQEAMIQALVDQAVEERLAGIPRPRYIPATAIAPPGGLLLYRSTSGFPLSVAMNGFMQLRWLEFARAARSWTNSAGKVLPINNINTFNLNRVLLTFSGHVLDERLVYKAALFGTSDMGVRSAFVPLGTVGWQFSEAATLAGGVTIVPSSREWVDGQPWTLGVDRSMVNTFFRPGFSPGTFFVGSLWDREVNYQAGVWNAIDGGQAGVLRKGTSMAWAGNTWWEPLGPFGLGYSDMEVRDDPVARFGMSGTYARTQAIIFPGLNPEDTIVRLSDGTPIALPNALGPESQLEQYLFQLATVDAGLKYGGWAVNIEYYFRLLSDFVGQGQFTHDSVYDHGGLGYLSWCFVPRTYEVYARSSVLTGTYGTGQEYGGGFNWYVNKSRQGRFTIEALYMNRNPAQNILYPYRAGYTGTAIQTQFMTVF
ncbi:MAG: hypothetical protein ACKO4Z_12625 [Planctomycetota bacterium]